MSPRKRKPMVDAQEMLQRALAAESELVEQAKKVESAQREANQWKALASLLVRHHGRPTGTPGTYVVTVPPELMESLIDSRSELYAESVEEGVRFTLRPEAYWSVPGKEESAALVKDLNAVLDGAQLDNEG